MQQPRGDFTAITKELLHGTKRENFAAINADCEGAKNVRMSRECTLIRTEVHLDDAHWKSFVSIALSNLRVHLPHI